MADQPLRIAGTTRLASATRRTVTRAGARPGDRAGARRIVPGKLAPGLELARLPRFTDVERQRGRKQWGKRGYCSVRSKPPLELHCAGRYSSCETNLSPRGRQGGDRWIRHHRTGREHGRVELACPWRLWDLCRSAGFTSASGGLAVSVLANSTLLLAGTRDGLAGGYSIAGTTFALDGGWHAYRVVVHGDIYRLFIDGRAVTTAVTIRKYRGFTGVGLWSNHYRIRVKDFRVVAAAPPVAGNDLDPEGLANLGLHDGAKPIISPVCLTVDQYAALRHLAVSVVRRAGMLASCATVWGGPAALSFGREVTELTGSITMFDTARDASWGYQQDMHADEVMNTAVQPLSTDPVGEEWSAFTYHGDEQFGPTADAVRVDMLDFRRGRYAVHLAVTGQLARDNPQDELAQLNYLAHTIDQRIIVARPAARFPRLLLGSAPMLTNG
jgi:hypothetical protein